MADVYSSVSPIHGTCLIGQPYGNPGNYSCGFHTGIDIPGGTTDSLDIYSVCSGRVVKVVKGISGRSPALGNEVDVLDANNHCFRFCHLVNGSNNHINVGDIVDTNTKLGIMGSTGNSTGVHLHLECSQGTAWVCSTFLSPGDVLGFGNVRGTRIIYDGGVTPPEPPPTPPEPEPDPGEGDFTKYARFNWPVYARKLRERRNNIV